MIELVLIFLRLLSDYFWEYKALSLFSAVVTLVAVTFFFFRALKQRGGLRFYGNELLALFLIFIFIFNTAIYSSSDNVVIVGKIIVSILMYFLGCYLSSANNKQLYALYFPVFLLVVFSFLSGSGFQQWGEVLTFSGGYYFKTDLALALTIFTVFLLVSNIHNSLKVMFIVVNVVFVLYSNARIYYVIFPLVCFAYYYREFIIRNAKYTFKMLAALLLSALAFIQISFFLLKNISASSNLLFFDFSQGFSSVNTQGRNIIWENLWMHYADSGMIKQLFGAGLTADVKYSEHLYLLEGFNAHNTYLYLLVSVGVIGLLVFLYFLYAVLKRFIAIASIQNLTASEKDNLFCFMSFAIIFLISGLTNVTIIFQQVSYIFFFYCGFLYNKNMFPSFYLTK